jgi:peptidoglycan-associated lipoprotein
MQSRASAPAVLVMLVMTSCGGADSPPPVAPRNDTKNSSAGPLAAQQPRAPTKVRISKEIQQACDLSVTEACFDFDSTRIRTTEDLALKKIADCFVGGPLAGREMVLVGHADPRGDEEYNVALGGRRSDAVANALIERNLKHAQISTASRGEMDATGTSEGTWAEKRKVDVQLAY